MGGLINMMFAGHWCSPDRSNIFAAVSLSGLYTNITFLSLLIGMSSALETLASQYNGAQDYKNVGISYHRSCIVLFCLSIPVIMMIVMMIVLVMLVTMLVVLAVMLVMMMVMLVVMMMMIPE